MNTYENVICCYSTTCDCVHQKHQKVLLLEALTRGHYIEVLARERCSIILLLPFRHIQIIHQNISHPAIQESSYQRYLDNQGLEIIQIINKQQNN